MAEERHAVRAAAGIDEVRDVRMVERSEDAAFGDARQFARTRRRAAQELSATRWRTAPPSRSASQTAPMPPSPRRSTSAIAPARVDALAQ
jgi:putative SOS response-associated peptidase YedK